MARRGYIGGSGDDDGDIAALLAARQQRVDPRLEMAMKLFQFGMGQQQEAAQEARLERGQAATERASEAQRVLDERRVALAEKGATDAETARKTQEIQESMKRGEDVGFRERQQKFAEETATTTQRQKEQDAALGTFEKALDKGYLTDTSGKFTTMGQEWLKDLDPKAAERLGTVAKLDAEKAYQEKLKSYKAMTPKKRAALEKPGSEAQIEELGGPEVYKRMVEEFQQAQPKPSLTPATGSAFGAAISKPWQEYQAPELSELVGPKIPAPAPSGTEGIAPWLRPEAPATGAMDWRYGGGGPSVEPGRYEKFPGSVEDLIAASGQQPLPAPQPPVPQEVGFLDQLLQKIRGRGGPGSPLPPIPPQGVFQPFPG